MATSIVVLDATNTEQTIATMDALLVRVGEVQASPTANTVLDRLKSINTNLTAIAGSTDGIETLITATNTILEETSTNAAIEASAANTNATVVKASAGTLLWISGYNTSSSDLYLKFYNKATTPTVGTDTVVLRVALPAEAAFNLALPFKFTTGISYGIVTGHLDTDVAAPVAGAIKALNVVYR